MAANWLNPMNLPGRPTPAVPSLNLAQRQLVQNQVDVYMKLNEKVIGRKPEYQLQQIRNEQSTRIAKELFGDQQKAAPAPAPAPAPVPDQSEAIAELTEASEAYRAEAEKAIAAGQARVSELENEELQSQRAAELQNRLAIQSAASQARGQMGAQLKIKGASQIAQTAGTQAFRRRRDQFRMTPIQSTAGINVPASNVLNV